MGDVPKRFAEQLLAHAVPHQRAPIRETGRAGLVNIEQTGGDFFSRPLLVLINRGVFFVAVVLGGVPGVYALPMAGFEGVSLFHISQPPRPH